MESFALPDALKSSGDTMTGALKLNGGIQQQTSADLSGTYAYHQLMLSDAFTVTGDVTISDNLVLAKLSDDSNAVTLTNDTSTRTVTGTGGSLEMGTLIQTPNASLTGMTGEIGSAVTGTLGSDIVFPAGHIIQTVYDTETTEANTGAGTGWKNTALSVAITPTASTSTIMITYSIVISVNTTGYSAITSVFRGDVSGTNLGHADYGTAFHGTSHLPAHHSAVVIDTPSTTSATTYTIGVRESADNQTYYCSNGSRATIIVQELAG